RYTYYRQPGWVDSMIFTTAFIQNDNTREVFNSAKGRNSVFVNSGITGSVNYGKADLLNVDYNFTNNEKQKFVIDSIQTPLSVELFEALFPPPGWRIFNQDGFITFQQYTGANGPTIGGSRSAIMDFYDYNIIGQKDSMYSKVYSNLLSADTVRFDFAYAQYNSFNIDSLIVKVSSDGGETFPVEIFRRGGLQLATAPQTTSFFIPTNNTQWRTFKASLSSIVSVNNFSNSIPSKFSLSQNYPNPFNPKTIISYELPVRSLVRLKVFDLLGREVSKLVNEQQNPGTYKLDFDGSFLASGIYFYQIITDGFTDTKRMVLIK
ncbi:MAG: T9SS type A sorting domain-containing protein, partial [Bacteroidota bacterium]|nr:T9SS type A sorting domain-containing protein [Bacteroidota bacterium]